MRVAAALENRDQKALVLGQRTALRALAFDSSPQRFRERIVPMPYTGEGKDVNMTKKEDPTGDKVVGFCNGLDDLAGEYLGNDWPPEIVGLGFLHTAINVLSAECGTKGTMGILASTIRKIEEEGIEGASLLGIYLDTHH